MTSTDNTPCSCDDAGCACECDDASSRRRFLERATTIALGAVSLTILPAWTGNDDDESIAGDAPNPEAKQTPLYGFLVDSQKCVGTGKCLTACRIENDVPEGNYRTWVERYVHFKDGTIQVDTVPETGYAESELPIIDPDKVDRAYFVPKLCNHCEDAPCNQVCPVHASFTSPEGVELVDTDRCIGCAYCVQACPYGVRFINSETGTADKCTWCYHRVTQDEQPACVEACPVGARLFGQINDPNSDISKRIAEVPTHVLKEHLGTHPKTRYVGITNEVT
ncbi:MAG: 4Fe-4S dicluster domain-containing protein [Pirellulaceae bacterium]|jgi:Fe-S-cluster-containing dehydrogenase component|nr:4Fe-4S dicluster domain-containing protein [Pirellulaceae bacterium]MDP6722398.1 4Fe-4S dicluster domain-containing protein [Pirellulaceae bacterium]